MSVHVEMRRNFKILLSGAAGLLSGPISTRIDRFCARAVAASLGVPTVRRWASALMVLLAMRAGATPSVLSDAQVEREYAIKSWHVENGLPAERVTALLQSRDGYLWIGTQNGIARFDGTKFTVFNRANTPQLASDYCNAIVEDSEGNLWLGFRSGGCLVRKSREGFKSFSLSDRHQSFDDCSLLASRSGGIWCGVGRWLYRLQGDTVKTYPLAADIVAGPIPLREEEDGTLILGGWELSSCFDPRSNSFERLPLFAGPHERSVMGLCPGSGRDAWMLSVDSSSNAGAVRSVGHVAVLKEGRLTRQLGTGDEGFVIDMRTRFLTRDLSGDLWLPGEGGGIIRYSSGRYELLPIPRLVEKEFPMCAITDREGNLWIGSDFSGLQRWTPRKVTTFGVKEGLPHNQVWSILQARDHSMWIGTEAGVAHLQNGRFTHYNLGNEPPANAIRSIVQDRDGTIWVGTIRLLESIRNGTLSEQRLPGPWEESKIRCLLAARDGALWVGTARGLSRLANGVPRKITGPAGLKEFDVRALLEDRDGVIWVGTAGAGLYRVPAGDGSLLTTTNCLSSPNIWALHEDSEGELWIGTDNGLNLLKHGRITAFTAQQGLPVNQVDSIVEDNFGRLWISHDAGLYWVPKAQLLEVAAGVRPRVQAVVYDETDGLPTPEFNGQKSNPTACKARDGRLWFPTAKGVVVVDPAKVWLDDAAPLTAIEQARANGKLLFDNAKPAADSVPRHSSLLASPGIWKLPPGGAKVLEFRYVSPTLLAPQKVRFRFRLLGLSDNWIEADDRREAYFTDLRPGDYTFEVVAANHHGVWQQHGATFPFSVAAHLYQSSWFYAASGLGLMSAVLGIGTWRVRELRRIHVLQQFKALAEQRERFARDVHDELGSGLNQIVNLSGDGNGEAPGANAVTERLQHIRRVADATLANVGQIVWATNPKYDTLFDLVGYLREFCAEYFELTGIGLTFDFPPEVPALPVTGLFRRQLLLAVKEALQNVVKHAAASEVKVRLALLENRLELCIGDNGRGLAPAGQRRKGEGIDNMSNRVARLGGVLTLQRQADQGTLVTISVPLPKQPMS